MSAVLILTPIVVSSWPAIMAAAGGAAAAMGFSLIGESAAAVEEATRVEVEIGESEIVAEGLERGRPIVLERDGVRIEIRQDERGACAVCASGRGTKRALRELAEEVSGRIVQQYVYHKLLTELKQREFAVVDQERLADDSVRVHVRL